MTCKTKMGKVFTIIYSSIGVPLMMLFLANIGSSTAALFKFIYLKVESIKRKLKNCKSSSRTNMIPQSFLIAEENDEERDQFNDMLNKQKYFKQSKSQLVVAVNTPKKSYRSSFKRKKNKRYSKENIDHDFSTKPDQQITKISKKKVQGPPVKNKVYTVSIGIRDVEIDKSYLNHVLNPEFYFRILKPDVDKLNHPNEIAICSSPANLTQSNDDKSLKLIEAMKKIDNLLDQESLADKEEAFYRDKFDIGSIKSLDRNHSLSSLDEYNKNKIKFNLNSDDENDDDLYHNSNFTDSENEDLYFNRDFLLTNIFNKASVKSKENEMKRSKSPSSNKVAVIKKDIFDEKIKNSITDASPTTVFKKSCSQGDLSKLKVAIVNEAKLQVKDTVKQELYPKQPATQLQLPDQHLMTKLTQSTTSIDKTENANPKKLTSVYSSPGFDCIPKLESNFKRTKNRSVYSYENADDKKRRMSKLNMRMPIYSEKQLDLIYKQYRRQKQDKLDVPMLTTLIIMPLYLVCGMLMFSSFEKWKKLDALYFCFVTLTTIGFGDMMPGSTLLNKNGNKNNLYISAIYIFVGLILIAMCINLMKDQLKYKIKSFARRIGLSNC